MPFVECKLLLGVRSLHALVHLQSPTRAIYLHAKNNKGADKANTSEDGKKPAISHDADERGCDKGAHARENIPYEVVQGYTNGRFLGHELGEHGSYHAED